MFSVPKTNIFSPCKIIFVFSILQTKFLSVMTRVNGLSAGLIHVCRSARRQIGGGVGGEVAVSGLVVFIVLRFFSTCSKPIFVAQGSPKTYEDTLYTSRLISYLSKFLWLVVRVSMITVQFIPFLYMFFLWNSWSEKVIQVKKKLSERG